MTTTILASKTGNMNMGGYFKEKTIRVYTHEFEGIVTSNYYRFGFIGDSTDECFKTIEEAMNRFNHFSKQIN